MFRLVKYNKKNIIFKLKTIYKMDTYNIYFINRYYNQKRKCNVFTIDDYCIDQSFCNNIQKTELNGSTNKSNLLQVRIIFPNKKNYIWKKNNFYYLNIEKNFAKKYNLTKNKILPFDYYLWVIRKQKEELKYITIFTNILTDRKNSEKFSQNNYELNKKYLLERDYAKKMNIEDNYIISSKIFNKIPKKYLKYSEERFVKINVLIPGNDSISELFLSKNYCNVNNILNHTYMSWETYKNHRIKIDIQNGINYNDELSLE